MAVIGVAEVAEELCLSARRVRQMLVDGDLRGERIGRAWIVERGEVDRLLVNRPEVGRPWRAEAAWAFLALAEGRAVELSAVDRSRILRRVDAGVEPNLGRLRSRSAARRFFAHPSVLARISDESGFVRSGVSAADEYSIDLAVADEAEGYVRGSKVEDLIDRFVLDESSDRPNLVLRVVADEVWPFDAEQSVASELVVVVDLLEASDERTRRSGRAMLGDL